MNFNSVFPSSNGKPTGGIDAFDAVAPAPQFTPVPAGVYVAVINRGELVQTRSGNDGYRIRFRIVEGPHAGQTVIRTWTFSERALPYTKRDLSQFGLTTSAQLLAPFPPVGCEFYVKLWIALQRSDDGREFSDVKKIDVIRVDESPVAAFLLPPRQSEGGPK